MSTNINFVNSLGLGSNTRVDFNLPRTILLKGEGRAVADGGVAEAELCSYNTLNGLNYNALLRSASLICTPNGYKEGTLYSVIPSDGSGDMSVVRATTATRVNSAGLVELVPYNLLQYSEQFDNAFYTKNNSSISVNATTAPNGTLTADKLVEDSSNGVHYIYIPASTTPSGTNTLSIYAKANGRDWIWLYLFDSVAGSLFGYFNVDNGTIGTISSGLTANIESVGNGWFRCSITRTQANVGNGGYGLANADNSLSYLGNGTSGAYLWGGQLVEGTLPKDYQKTETRLNIPRLDYSNGTCPSLLVEPQRTNLSLYSEQFDNGYWLGNTTKTANNTIAPNGINSADRINATAINFFHRVNGLSSVNSGTAYTFSVYAKANTLGFIQLALNTGFTNDYSISPYANFNLTTGIISQIGNGATAQIESLGNGWYRCSITATSIANALGEVNINLINSGTLSAFQFWSANATDSLFIWGAQLEAGSYPTLYIPTTSASVTRNADVVSKTGISSLIGQTEGTIFYDLNLNSRVSYNYIFLGNAITYIGVYIDNAVIGLEIVNGTLQTSINYSNSNKGRFKIGIAYKNNDVAFYVNGILVGTDNTCNVPALSAIDLTYNPTNSIGFNATALWKTRLTNTQLAQLTTI